MSIALSEISDKRFNGLRSIYGEKGLAHLQAARVAVIGIGGVGSWAVEALARNAVGHISMIDLDIVSESNINRQLPAMSSTLGMDKTQVMQQRIADINPNCQVSIVDDFVTVDNVADILGSSFDYVIDCVDSFRVKAAIIHYCKRQKVPLITVGGAGGQIDPLKIKLVDLSRTQHDQLLAKTRKLLRQDYRFARNPKRSFGIPCVYSDEQIRYADGQGGVTSLKPDSAGAAGLSCAGGLGSTMQVTASFAMVAVAHVVAQVTRGADHG